MKNNYKKILTIQDISCIGQCSLTVALPILSACGIETAILPSAVLSTHTAGFKGYTFRDLTEDIPLIAKHWIDEGISFDSVYTGYLGSCEQIAYVKDIIDSLMKKDGVSIVDPAMADNGKLYPAFDNVYVEHMKTLAFSADIIVPNITEACLLADYDYKDVYDEEYIKGLLEKLSSLGASCIVLTGVGFRTGKTGVIIFDKGSYRYYEHEKIDEGCHGTGDVYASAFTGALISGKSVYDSAVIAADYTLLCIKNTSGDKEHWYGVKFEPELSYLIDRIVK